MEPLSPRPVNVQPVKIAVKRDAKSAREINHPEDPPSILPYPGGGTFDVLELVGLGGFAKAFKCQRKSKIFCVKVVKKDPGHPKMKEKFQSELQVHSKMHHPNIVQYFSDFAHEKNHYVLMELCSSGSLMDLVRRRKMLTEPEVRYFLVQLAGAVKYMHSKNVIHRDIKLGNVFLDDELNVKLGDFGLAALLMEKSERKKTICGTPNYIAPEILQKGGHSNSVDIWSLGVMAFAMLTGLPPFQAKTRDDIYQKIHARDYTWPDRNISQEAKDLVASLLVDADKRPTPDEIVAHPFFNGYIPIKLDISYKTTKPEFPTASQNYHAVCRRAGVGRSPSGALWPCVGSRGGKHVLRELHDEMAQLVISPQKPPSRLPQPGLSQAARDRQSARPIKVPEPAKLPSSDGIQANPRRLRTRVEKPAVPELDPKRSVKLISSKDRVEHLSHTLPKEVTRRLDAMLRNITSSLTKSPQTTTQVYEDLVHVKQWVDYTEKYGLGYVLSDRSVGCLYLDLTACVQRVGEMEFLESSESGFFRTVASAGDFSTSWDSKGAAKTTGPGRTQADALKKKKVTLMRRFEKYMNEGLGRAQSTTSKSQRIVTFFQRFRDVSCLGFDDNSLQFIFPDHTKLVLAGDSDLATFFYNDGSAVRAMQRGERLTAMHLERRGSVTLPLTCLTGHSSARTNALVEKLEFVHGVLSTWIAAGGIGLGDSRLEYRGLREANIEMRSQWACLGYKGQASCT